MNALLQLNYYCFVFSTYCGKPCECKAYTTHYEIIFPSIEKLIHQNDEVRCTKLMQW